MIEPSGITFEKHDDHLNISNPLSAGFLAKFFITPANVNFTKISVGENDVTAIVTGYFIYELGENHPPNSPFKLTSHVAGKGTTLQGFDEIRGGSIGPTYSEGTFTWNIPWRYEIGGTEKVFTNLQHVKRLFFTSPDGKWRLSLSKQGLNNTSIEQ